MRMYLVSMKSSTTESSAVVVACSGSAALALVVDRWLSRHPHDEMVGIEILELATPVCDTTSLHSLEKQQLENLRRRAEALKDRVP